MTSYLSRLYSSSVSCEIANRGWTVTGVCGSAAAGVLNHIRIDYVVACEAVTSYVAPLASSVTCQLRRRCRMGESGGSAKPRRWLRSACTSGMSASTEQSLAISK